MSAGLSIRPLTVHDAEVLSAMLLAQPESYIRHFRPFDFGLDSIRALLDQVRQDVFMGIFWEASLAGFFMLRGWDEGYTVPAYGVVIDQQFQGKSLGALTLSAAKAICRLRGVTRLMLKVYPENAAAKHLYEKAGFVQTGLDPKNHNLIYHFDFT